MKKVHLASLGIASAIPLTGVSISEAPLVWPLATLIFNIGLIQGFAILPKRRITLVIFSFIASAMLILETSFFVSFYLQNAGFNEAFFYHLHPDLIYAGIGEHVHLVFLFLGVIVSYLLTSNIYIRKNVPQRTKHIYICAVLILSGLFISPPINSLARYIHNNRLSHLLISNEKFPELSNTVRASFQGENRYNVVLIYQESVEQRYFDENVFPELLPELKKIKSESLAFANVSGEGGAGFTVAGIVASQCGYPLAGGHNIHEGNFGIFDNFMPGAACLGDLLQADGYHLAYMGAADSRFAGKGNFLRSHGYSEVIDKDRILERLPYNVPLNYWGGL